MVKTLHLMDVMVVLLNPAIVVLASHCFVINKVQPKDPPKKLRVYPWDVNHLKLIFHSIETAILYLRFDTNFLISSVFRKTYTLVAFSILSKP